MRVGATVRLIYETPGLTIVTNGQSMQNGIVGQSVRVRNLDSGLIVTGNIQTDGSVKVNGG